VNLVKLRVQSFVDICYLFLAFEQSHPSNCLVCLNSLLVVNFACFYGTIINRFRIQSSKSWIMWGKLQLQTVTRI